MSPYTLPVHAYTEEALRLPHRTDGGALGLALRRFLSGLDLFLAFLRALPPESKECTRAGGHERRTVLSLAVHAAVSAG